MRIAVICLCAFCTISGLAASEESDGQRLYTENCMACHQENGQGIPNVFPALDGSEVVRGSADDVALTALIGRGDMPSFRDSLSPVELAAIVSYVRKAWSNTGGSISPERIVQLRDNL